MSKTSNIALYIDPPSHHFLNDQLFNVNDGRLNGDNILAPYAYVREYFTSRGIPVHTVDYMPQKIGTVQNVYVSMGRLENYRKIAKRSDTILSAFFAMECPIVEPSMYLALNKAQHYFKRILSWSDSQSLEHFTRGRLQLESFRWPQSFDKVHETIWNQTNRKFLVMINSNKLPNVYWKELYTERLRAVEYFSRTDEIDLYGVGWDKPSWRVGKTWVPYSFRLLHHKFLQCWQRIYPDPLLKAAKQVYCGPAKSKAETLGEYTFAICFENMILTGWITEKIFDCFFAGTIPIYWGAPDIENYIPSECFIDMRHFGSYEDLRNYLKSLSEKDILNYKENSKEYLKSPQFLPFTKEAFVGTFRRMVEEDAGIQIT